MKSILTILLSVLSATQILCAAETGTLDPNLEVLRPFLGNWRGEFKNSTPENPVVDISSWERALNGKAIRILHSINDGAYGGETLVTWNAEKKSIVYHYFSTADFQTRGTMKMEGKKILCHETVSGSADGITEVKATVELRDDGTMSVDSTYLKNGNWEPGRSTIYKRADGARPVFK